MTQRISPFLEGKYGWEYGESGWNSGMDENLLKFSFMFEGAVDEIADTLPVAANGTSVFLTTDNRLYFSVGTVWYSSPCPKWFEFIVKSSGQTYQFDGVSANIIDNASQLNNRLSSVELTISQLGSAAFEDVSLFATQAALDIASSQANAYSDQAVTNFRNTLADSPGASLVGFRGGDVEDALNQVVVGIVGAAGDGITDDTAAIQSAVNASTSTVKLEQGKTYKITDKILINHPIAIDLNGSTIQANFTTTVPAFDVQSNHVRICNGAILVNGTTMGGYGGSLNCIYAGNQATGAGWYNLRFHDLTVTTNRDDAGAHIGVIGECRNVVIENIHVPDNTVCRNIIGIEWGGTTAGTGHPHNVIVRNLNIGRITTATYGNSGYAYAVWISAAFNVKVENIKMVEGYGLVMATRGDNANTYAPVEYKHLVGRGISVENASIGEAFGYGIRAIGSHRSATLDNIPMSVHFKNIKVGGKKVGANNNFAFSVEQSDGVVLEDFEFSGVFAAGVVTGINNDNLRISNGVISGSELYGGQLSNTCRWASVEGVTFFANNTLAGASTSTSALVLDSAEGITINDCIFGLPGTTETQKYSISATSSTLRPKLNRNHTYALAASGVAYLMGASGDTSISASGIDNTAESGLVVASGSPIFQIQPNGDKTFVSTAVPTNGTYAVGDKVYFSSPAASGFIGAVCTTAGTPGTWKNFGAIVA